MKRRRFQIEWRHRLVFYALGLALLISGSLWAWIQHLDDQGRAGETLRRMKTDLIALHGWCAMGFVLLLGTLLVSHVRRAWVGRRNRPNGAFFLGAVGLLTLSGYALYYLADDRWRAAAGDLHLWLGLAAPALLGLHIWVGRQKTADH